MACSALHHPVCCVAGPVLGSLLLQACHTTCSDIFHSLLAGLFTWWVLQKAPGRGQVSRVVAIEPMPQNVAVMQANLQQHGLSSQVIAPLALKRLRMTQSTPQLQHNTRQSAALSADVAVPSIMPF